MPRPVFLFCLAAIACSPGPDRDSKPSPLADLPRQEKIRVNFYWQIPNTVPPHEITDSLQVAAIMAILNAPGDWKFERAWPLGEQQIILAERDGRPLRVWFCPGTIVVRSQDERTVRSISAATYDSLMRLTGSRPYDADGDTTIAKRARLCHLTHHEPVGSFALFLGLVGAILIAGVRLFDTWRTPLGDAP